MLHTHDARITHQPSYCQRHIGRSRHVDWAGVVVWLILIPLTTAMTGWTIYMILLAAGIISN